MNRVAIDDPVTIVFASPLTICTVVEKVERTQFYCKADNGFPDLGGVPFDHAAEGTFWVRGWHTPDSEPVKAALSAQAFGDAKPAKVTPYRELKEALAEATKRQAEIERRLNETMRRQQAQQTQLPHGSSTPHWNPGRTPSDEAWDAYTGRGMPTGRRRW